ncbi:manganese-dependent inorganic pyrophosphatase [candidate division WWE3 bacterium]|nr:manganese-dependent inorganic pyrophosphatase [candidate division WWE3 bacterium]
MMKIYITGHKSPDLDSVVAAIAYTELLKKTDKYSKADLIPTIPGEINKETEFVLDKFEVKMPDSLDKLDIEPEAAFILVDHNEESQRHEETEGHTVLEIIDHHKVNLNFASPLQINIKPLGSTSSIIYQLFKREGINPSKKVKELLLSAILSDTQGLKSSTTTGIDSEIAHELADDLKMELDKLTFEIFRAKSDITGLSAQEITKKDYKTFQFGEHEVFINQIETVEPEKVLDMKENLIKELEEVKTELGLSTGYIVITDILEVNSHVIYSNETEKEILEEAFTAEGKDGIADIGPRMSRKKDIAPAIEKVLTQ